MCILARRLQILIDEDRYQRLLAQSRDRNLSVAAVIREAIDTAFPARSPGRAEAAKDILAASRMPVPDPAELRAELDEIRASRR